MKEYADYNGNSDANGARNQESSRTRRHRVFAKAKFGHPDQDRHPVDVSWVRGCQHGVGHFRRTTVRRTTDREDTAFPLVTLSRGKVSF